MNFKATAFILFFAVMASLPLPNSFAQYDIKEMTPQVQQAIAGRQARYGELQSLKAAGKIGENNRGYVEALSGDAAAVVEAENNDRRVIYTAIAEQNNLGPTGLAVIETVFAEVQHEKARPGDMIQLPTGEWTKKA